MNNSVQKNKKNTYFPQYEDYYYFEAKLLVSLNKKKNIEEALEHLSKKSGYLNWDEASSAIAKDSQELHLIKSIYIENEKETIYDIYKNHEQSLLDKLDTEYLNLSKARIKISDSVFTQKALILADKFIKTERHLVNESLFIPYYFKVYMLLFNILEYIPNKLEIVKKVFPFANKYYWLLRDNVLKNQDKNLNLTLKNIVYFLNEMNYPNAAQYIVKQSKFKSYSMQIEYENNLEKESTTQFKSYLLEKYEYVSLTDKCKLQSEILDSTKSKSLYISKFTDIDVKKVYTHIKKSDYINIYKNNGITVRAYTFSDKHCISAKKLSVLFD